MISVPKNLVNISEKLFFVPKIVIKAERSDYFAFYNTEKTDDSSEKNDIGTENIIALTYYRPENPTGVNQKSVEQCLVK